MSEHHFTHSTFREHIIEHVFLGDLLRALWNKGERGTDVAVCVTILAYE